MPPHADSLAGRKRAAARRFRFRLRQASDGLEVSVVDPRSPQPVTNLRPLVAGQPAANARRRRRRKEPNGAAPPAEEVRLRRSDELLFQFLTQRGVLES